MWEGPGRGVEEPEIGYYWLLFVPPSYFRLQTKGCTFVGKTLAWHFPPSAVAIIRIFLKGRDGEMGELP